MTKAERAHLARWARELIAYAEQKTNRDGDLYQYATRYGALLAGVTLFAESIEGGGRLPVILSPAFVGPIQQQQPAPPPSPMAQSCIDAVGGTIARAVGHE